MTSNIDVFYNAEELFQITFFDILQTKGELLLSQIQVFPRMFCYILLVQV